MTDQIERKQQFFNIILLILAGEAVFILPYVLARIFRPTFLKVFELNNFELGVCFSTYGIVALASYLLGGSLADRYKPNTLMSLALILTALGGVYMATFPTYSELKMLYGYWGFTTIFLFWSAMIKATRIWGGTKKQGLAFGFLDSGRGLVAAGVGSLGILIFSLATNIDLEKANLIERQEAFYYVILASSAFVAGIALLVFFFLKTDTERSASEQKDKLSWIDVKKTLKIPAVWWLMLIVLCAYVGYKITDIFSLYANEVMNMDEVNSAKVGSFLLYIRPIAGVSIGLLADRSKPSKWMIFGFSLMIIGAVFFASGAISDGLYLAFFISLVITALGTYAIRTLYFAALQEGAIPLAVTGTAVGLISFIGYTPDIFMGPLTGVLLDGSPGITGHQHVFIVLLIFSFIGLIASIFFYRGSAKSILAED